MMDLKMPGMSGIEATRQVKGHSPNIVVLVLTGSEDPDHLFEVLKAGAAGYLLKGATGPEIVETGIIYLMQGNVAARTSPGWRGVAEGRDFREKERR
jgi:DNA-binding NarL/FixJ family response regulator